MALIYWVTSAVPLSGAKQLIVKSQTIYAVHIITYSVAFTCFTFASWFLVICSSKQIILYVYFFSAFILYSFFETLFTQCLKSLLNAWDRLWQYETLKSSLIENRTLLCMPNMIVYNSPKSKERHESTSNSWKIKVKCVI